MIINPTHSIPIISNSLSNVFCSFFISLKKHTPELQVLDAHSDE